MCGITGLSGPFEAPVALLDSMTQALSHRGPDQCGKYTDSNSAVILGHRRLSILDTSSAGRQPMESERAVVVCNGEIYNFRELRRQLENRHQFTSNSDSEVLLHGYAQWGIKGLLARIKGMFAFVIYDKQKKRLHMVRDRMGEKPLYFYSDEEGRFAFASELKALQHVPGANQIDQGALDLYFTFGYVPAPACIVRRCTKLAPGHRLELDVRTNKHETFRYWRLDPAAPKRAVTETEAAERVRILLERSMDISLFSDVPLGVFMSGGLDSSILSVLANKRNPAIRTFSVTYDDPSFDESQYSRLMARHLGSDHVELKISSDEARQAVMNMPAFIDEPMSDMSLIPTHLLAQKAREHVTVVVGGDGADELFIGYPTHLAHKLAKLYTALPATLRKKVIEPAIKALPPSYKDFSLEFRLKRFVASAYMDTAERHFSWQAHIPFEERSHLHGSTCDAKARLQDFLQSLPISKVQNDFALVEYLDLTTYLPNDILSKIDIAAMAVGLETRSPYLDYELVEYAHSLPERLKFRLHDPKYILKKIGLDLVPKEIVKRKKHGFGIPIGRWLRNELYDHARERLLSGTLEKAFPMNRAYVEELLKQHHQGRRDNRKQIWSLLTLYNWMESYGLA